MLFEIRGLAMLRNAIVVQMFAGGLTISAEARPVAGSFVAATQ